MLDAGTDNEELLGDRLYVRRSRCSRAQPCRRPGGACGRVRVGDMNRAIALLTCLAALLLAAPAHAAPKSCTRDGATLLAGSGHVRVVSVKEKPRNSETRRSRIYGCSTTDGRRFTMFLSRDFGLDLIQRDDYTIVDGRYVGVLSDFEGGVSESRTAAVYDVKTRSRIHASTACDSVDFGDFSGVRDAVFFDGGGMAYACGRLRIADGKGDRELEPPGTDVLHLAVSENAFGFGPRLYWTANGVAKSLDV
jgi:hypothetical protein